MDDGKRIGFDGWRCVDFTNKTKPLKDKVYVFRFPRYSTKEFKLVGIKQNTYDKIKWGFGTQDSYLDPVWLSDRVKSYDNLTKTVTITNESGSGSTLAKVKLDTPHTNFVMPGNNRLLGQMKINLVNGSIEDLNLVTELFYAKDMRNMSRVVTHKYAIYGEVEVNDFIEVCEDFNEQNGTVQSCHSEIVGSHMETQIIEWKSFKDVSKIKQKEITVGVFADVEIGDYG